MQNIARKVLASVRDMVPGGFHTRDANPQSHPHVAWKEYDGARRRLQCSVADMADWLAHSWR